MRAFVKVIPVFVAGFLGCWNAAQAVDPAAAQQKLDIYQQQSGVPKTALMLPDKFIVAQDPPGLNAAPPRHSLPADAEAASTLEKSQGVNGTLYTAIAPIYLGGGPDGGNTSFVRFYNRETHSTTFSISIVGYRTDTTTDSKSAVIGTATVTVPPDGAPQYSVDQIFTAAGIGSTACPTTCPANVYQGVALYVRSPDDDVGYQHVIFNLDSKFFENVTICGDDSISDGSANPYIASVIDVHTSLVSALGYPGSVVVHNYASTNSEFSFFVQESEKGDVKGAFKTTLLANSTYVIPMTYFETNSNWAPTGGEGHANIIIFNLTGGTLNRVNAVAGAVIYNQELKAYINMSQICRVSH